MDFMHAFDRRSFLRGTATAFGAAALASLGVSASEFGKVSVAKADAAERIVVGRPADSDNLDPVTCVGNTNIFIFNLILEGLIMTSDDGSSIEPCLAENWDISGDGCVYTFHVKEGLVFSDGTPVTAEDWQWTFDRAIETTDSNWHSSVENIDHVECPDDTTVVVTLKQPAAATLANLCIFTLGAQSKAYFEKVGEEEYKKNILGCGPYMVKEWKKGEYLTLEANPNYHDAGFPLTKEIEFKVVADDNSRTIQLQGGDIDIATDLPLSTLSQLESDPNCVPHPDPSTVTRFLALNVKNEYLSNPDVRKALSMATNPQEIVTMANFGYGTAIGSIFAPTSQFCDTSLAPNTPDVEGAKALLESAGLGGGFTVNLLIKGGNSFEQQVATILQYEWSLIGVTLNIQESEATAYKTRMYDMDFDLLIDYWSDDIQDPAPFMKFIFDFSLASGFDTNFEQPAEMIALNDAANLETDIEKRKELYAQIQQGFAEQSVWIPIMSLPWQNAVRREIDGFVQTPLGNYRFKNLVKNV